MGPYASNDTWLFRSNFKVIMTLDRCAKFFSLLSTEICKWYIQVDRHGDGLPHGARVLVRPSQSVVANSLPMYSQQQQEQKRLWLSLPCCRTNRKMSQCDTTKRQCADQTALVIRDISCCALLYRPLCLSNSLKAFFLVQDTRVARYYIFKLIYYPRTSRSNYTIAADTT